MTTQERAHYWHEQITIWRSSGLSGQAFCNQHDLAYHQFIYWRAKQDKTGADQQDTAVGFARVAPSRAVSTCGECNYSAHICHDHQNWASSVSINAGFFP